MTGARIELAEVEGITATPGKPLEYSAEASSLGLKPGEWPEFLPARTTEGGRISLQRWAPIHSAAARDGWEESEQELVAVEYRHMASLVKVRVYND